MNNEQNFDLFEGVDGFGGEPMENFQYENAITQRLTRIEGNLENLFQELRSGQHQARGALNPADANVQESLDFAILESAKNYAKSTLSIDKMYKTATKILEKAEIETQIS